MCISCCFIQYKNNKLYKKKFINNCFFVIVREVGLEPTRLCGATPSRWCVCQFRHSRWIYKINIFIILIKCFLLP